MKNINNRTKKGSALAYVLVMIVVVVITLTSLLGYISSQIGFSKDRVERERAFQTAEAGIYFYRWYLAHQVSGRTAQQISDFWNTGSPYGVDSDYGADYADPEGGLIGRYSLHVEKPVDGSTIVTVTSTGYSYNKPSAKRVIKVRFRRPSWSENVVLANDNMRFGQGTVIAGKIFSNKGVRMDGYANNVVSSALATYDDPDHNGGDEFAIHTHVNVPPGSGVNDTFRSAEASPNPILSRADVFGAGRVFPAPQIDFTSIVSDLSFMRSKANIKYDNTGAGRQIILKSDGNFDMCKVRTYSVATSGITGYEGVIVGATGGNIGTNGLSCALTTCCTGASCPWVSNSNHAKGRCQSLTTVAIPQDGIIFIANNAWIEGTINNKKISIVAAELTDEPGYTTGSKNIFLGMNNLLYTNTDGSDIIGLIAQNNIEVIKNSLSNLTIDAALLAKDGRVGRKNYSDNKNTITVNGSIATNLRYGFSYTGNSYNCGDGVFVGAGYCNRNLNFDNNLLYYPPPYFPTGTEYSIDQWDEL